ncbi:TetR/AcrR family transcriptional regulator [Amycolatopsis sp. NPDC059021]|uniref:TetR/AcrR family transcriptional regulator n=1 Tax=Amycolatopsis sp. NPDC059021 TaxID=3346704 RepID=UPI003671A5DA
MVVNRRDAVIESATELFAERGFGGAGVEDIAAAVGVTPGALYRHFAGKEAILTAVLHDAADRSLALTGRLPRTGEPAASLRELVGGAVAFALDRPGSLRAYARERQRIRDERLRAKERRLLAFWERTVLRAAPDVGAGRVAVRARAVLSAVAAVMRPPRPVGRPRLDEMLTEAMLRVMCCPATASVPEVPVPGWRPPRGKREEILVAALALFRERGFHSAGVDDVAKVAGLAGSGLYRYYQDKTAILVDAYDRASARVSVGAENAVAAAAGPADALERLVRSYVDVAFSDVDLITVTAREGFAVPESERAGLARRYARVRDLWVAVACDRDPGLAEAEAQLLTEAAIPLITQLALAGPDTREEAVYLALALFGDLSRS